MTNNLSSVENALTEQEVRKRIEMYYENKHTGPLDLDCMISGLDRFFTEDLKGKTWEDPQNQSITISGHIENLEPVGEDSGSIPTS